ncbi:MAG: helix-turn-helix domain-containing protein [Acidobacteria bacterium]|nr:helix-turn-helix domain-containing protein [Acidobacteriota bacterium]
MIDRRGAGRSRRTRNGLCYTTSELAAVLGVGERLARLWVSSGLFDGADRCPAWRGKRGRWRVPVASVEVFLQTYPMLLAFLPAPPPGYEDHRPVLARARAESDWITVPEAARRMRVHQEAIRRLARDGDIVAVQVRRSWWVSARSLRGRLAA